VVAIVDEATAAEEAARLDEVPVSAFACVAPGPATAAAAAATKSVPVLSLAEVADPDGALAARAHACDGACIARGADGDRWNAIATAIRSTRMLPLASVTTKAELDRAEAAGAKAALLRASSVAEALDWAAAAPRTLTLVALVEGAALDELRSLEKQVDAVCVTPVQHRDPGFTAFVAAVDP
jgi:hypothetical protein